MFKFCPNVDQGIVIPIKSCSIVTTRVALAFQPSFDNFLKLLVFSELVTCIFIGSYLV